MTWVFLHLPHLLPPLLAFGFLAKLGAWASDQPPQQLGDEEVEVWERERAARKAAKFKPVRPGVARIGVIALFPAFAAIITGLLIYTFNLRDDRPSSGMIWLHVAVSVAALAITTWKVGLLGRPRLRRDLSLKRPDQGLSSLVLMAFGVPLLATGFWLLWRPSGSSLGDYVHLVSSVWWTLLLQWHLWRYLGRALGATFGTGQPRAPQAVGAADAGAPADAA